MNRLVLPLAALLAVAAPAVPPVLGAAAAVAETADDPEAIVRAIYGQWAAPCCTYFNVIDTHFSPKLAKLYKDVQEGAGDDIEYAIDFDIFLDAQDDDTVTEVVTSYLEKGDDRAVVAVSYKAFGETREQTYTFVKTKAGWKIDDMGWGPDRPALRAMLDDLEEQQRKSR
ncbi:MAG TPA: hypothetical protein PKA74_13260 [Bauldia sp.]|nr:hypothetical protein [Bauldia sp.]